MGIDSTVLLQLKHGQVPLDLRVNQRARRLILKVDTVRRRVVATIPARNLTDEAIAFAQNRRAWIEAQLARGPALRPFLPDMPIKLFGVPHHLTHVPDARGVRPHRDAGNRVIVVGGELAHFNRRVTDWIKSEARLTFRQQADLFATKIDRTVTRITIRDTRSRWGSCSSQGAISLNWRLALAPRPASTYVVAHEVAHLVHLNHSPDFWALVANLLPDWRTGHNWIKTHSTELYGFGVASPAGDWATTDDGGGVASTSPTTSSNGSSAAARVG